MTPARLQTIEGIFRAALDQKPEQLSAFLDTACEGDELLCRKVNCSWLHITERATSLQRQLLLSPQRLLKMSKLIPLSGRRSATTKFPGGSAPAGWAKSIWPPTLRRAAKPR